MTDRDRLIMLCNEKTRTMKFQNSDHWFDFTEKIEEIVDYLLANGVIVPHRLMGRLVYEINYDKKEKTCFIKSSKGGLEITLGNRL